MTTAPSTDTLLAPDPLLAPKRRDVPALAAALAAIIKGTEISVLYRTERYGTYRVTGPSRASAGFPGPILAGHPVAPTGKAATDVVLIDASPDEVEDLHTPALVAPLSVAHGDLVVAHFETRAWGAFAITGHAVALGTDALMVGGWLLVSKSKPGKHLVSVTLLDPAESASPVPPRALIDVSA